MDIDKSWDEMTAEEKEAVIQSWESEPGNLCYIIKNLDLTEADTETALKVLDQIRTGCNEAGTHEWEYGDLETVRGLLTRKLKKHLQNRATSANYH